MNILSLQIRATWILAGVFGSLFLAFNFCTPLIMPGWPKTYWANVLILSLIGTVAGCCDWLVGILMSPLQNQAAAAGKVAAALSIIWSTALAINFVRVARGTVKLFEASASTSNKIQLLFALGVFILGVAATFNTRIDGRRPAPK
jgi:hypothetical protein